MDAIREKSKDYTLITIIFAFFVFFTASDLAFNAFSKLEFASICSFTSGFLVFLGSFVVKKKKIEKGVNNRIDYVLSNFTWGNKVLGVLDFFFSIIALLTAIYWLGLIFRIGVVVRLACTLNKVKSVLKPIIVPMRTVLVGIFVYLGIRFKPIIIKLKESKVVKTIKKFFQWIWANKKSLLGTITAIATSIATAYATYGGYFGFLPELNWLGVNWMSIIVAVIIFALLELGVTGKGFEKIATFLKRVAEEKAEKQAQKEIKAEKKAEKAIEKEAIKQIKKAEKEALAEQKANEEAKAKADAEAYKALIEAKKAELIAKKMTEQK